MTILLGVPPVWAASLSSGGAVARGHEFVRTHCATCHAVEREGTSPYDPAPPFRLLHEKYDVEGLAEAFAEGIVVGHKGPRQMPEFRLEPDRIDDLIAYLKSLETSPLFSIKRFNAGQHERQPSSR